MANVSKKGRTPEGITGKGTDPSSSVSGDTSVSLGADSDSVPKKLNSTPHLACIDGNLNQMLASPRIRDQEDILSVGQEITGNVLFSKEGNADHKSDNDEEVASGEYKVDDKSNSTRHFDWNVEGLDELDGSQICHVNAFYTLLKK
jgi:hypothetical protein